MSSATNLNRLIFAHTPGRTLVTYSPDGRYFYTIGSNNIIRKFTVASDDDPQILDTAEENTGLAASNKHIFTSSEDCTVSCFSVEHNSLEKLLVRTTLPTRDIALSPDGEWVAVASDETVVKVVSVETPSRTFTLREQSNSNKHVAFHPLIKYLLAVSCTDGSIYIYNLTSMEPELVKKVDGVISRIQDPAAEASAKIAWCPDGRAFAAPTPTGDVIIIDRQKWERQRSFASGHGASEITDLAWSPNGAFLATAGKDGKIVIWESKNQTIIARYDYKNVCSLAWHPTDNTITFATSDGTFCILPSAVPTEHVPVLRLPTCPAPLLSDSLASIPAEIRPRPPRASSNPVDSFLGDLGDDDDFISDDDGAGYAEPNANGKRPGTPLEHTSGPNKRPFTLFRPEIHEPFQPSSTPWKSERRYLCLNMVGFVWTLDQGTHHTVTVEFHDREQYRAFHFTDTFLYDKACLNENGTLFACPPNERNGEPAMLYYRPHETWTKRVEWRTSLPDGEYIVAIALSENHIVACTSNGYVRVYTLFGVPIRLYRQKYAPIVTCASFRDYVLVLGNGPVGADGRAQLLYTLENVKRDETLQSNDVVALRDAETARNVFFSEEGDPMVYDSEGVLLVLMHWREMGQAKWVPVLDTRRLEKIRAGGKREYWPVAAGQGIFHCIILKNGEEHPYFPRPMFSEFPFEMPLSNPKPKPEGSEETSSSEPFTTDDLEQTYLLSSTLLTLQTDSASNRVLDADDRISIAKGENGIDRALLQLLMLACKDEAMGERALEICGLFKQKRTLDMAVKVALKYERTVLAGKIAELRDEMDMEEE
ncbi:WD40 repeat-like protein [Ascodesmis nigricans]|uniref:WD40 repeat-like protein n=1 Tax=Ascodesmis nigricans TaxID=341454 RepID=A0A4S2N281_9PEZI|nr:WD40 repeat-like protein [Ascodesmis nigricans]